ncbi:MAG: hypothetical protein Q9218_002234 [Villophora microphyllina]
MRGRQSHEHLLEGDFDYPRSTRAAEDRPSRVLGLSGLHNTDCSVACPGDSQYLCGGGNRLSWYLWKGPPLYVWNYPTGAAAGQYQLLIGGVCIPLLTTSGVNGKYTFVEKFGTGEANSTGAYELDVSQIGNPSLAWRTMHVKTDVFCSASITLPDKAGRQINIGGWSGTSTFGVRLYWPDGSPGVASTNDWQENVNELTLQKGRWYPSAMIMTNGSILVVGGEIGSNSAAQPNLEILPRPAGAGVVALDWLQRTDPNNLYPFLAVVPSGIFVAYYNEARILDERTFATIKTLPAIPGAVNNPGAGRSYPLEGTAMLLPQYAPFTAPLGILICGGSTIGGGIALDNCVSTQPEAANPQWTLERMPSQRVMPCMTALPDGTYMMLNGAHQGVAGFGLATSPNLNAILYDPSKPVNQRMSVMANTTIARLYHSEAILMQDARVLVSGSDPQDGKNPEEYRVEVFVPPYLLSGAARPSFTIANKNWAYGASIPITVTLHGGGTTRVSMMGAESSTHGNSMGQRTLFPAHDKSSRGASQEAIVRQAALSHNLRVPLLNSVLAFDLPPELLASLQLKDQSATQLSKEISSSPPDTSVTSNRIIAGTQDDEGPATSCVLCGARFSDNQEQRRHVRSDWHGYNLKQKLRGSKPVTEGDFEKLVEDLNESLSGSDSSSSEDDDDPKESTLTTLLKKQARIGHPETEEGDEFTSKRRKRGAGKPPLIWFSTSLLPPNTSLGVYRALFTAAEQEREPDPAKVLRSKQLQPASPKPPPDGSDGVPLPSTMTSPHIFLCMIGGGHFAGMIVSLAPKVGKKPTGAEERQATVIAHKTFHRYTTRRKQGGAQSSNDSAKGAAHSAGASIRRYNEAALESEIRALLAEWKRFIDDSQLIFVRATGSANRRTLFGPYDGQVLRHNDSRNRGFPFSTRRATQAELMRAFVELTRVKVSEVDEAALAAAAATEEIQSKSTKPLSTSQQEKAKPLKPSPEEEMVLHHTTQLQALIRRNKAPALLSYLSTHRLSGDFNFQPPNEKSNYHSPTSLHLAASTNAPPVVNALLTRAEADPTTMNRDGKVAFDLAGDRDTRDAFRVARYELGEEKWDWKAAHVPSGIPRSEVEERNKQERMNVEREEIARRRAEEERLKKEDIAKGTAGAGDKRLSGKVLGAVEKTGAEKREEEARGLTPEMRMRLERERRARAAEARMRGGMGSSGGR